MVVIVALIQLSLRPNFLPLQSLVLDNQSLLAVSERVSFDGVVKVCSHDSAAVVVDGLHLRRGHHRARVNGDGLVSAWSKV